MMKIGIIGGGISGCFAALKIKELHPDYEVVIFEHNDKLLKKIYATGNGKCNFANSGDLRGKYSNETRVLPILKDFGYEEISKYFSQIGIPNILEDNLAYPMSKSAQTVGMILDKRINDLGIKYFLNTKVKNYKIRENCIDIELNDGSYSVDKLIVSCGGKSSPQLGSDGSIFDVLKQHNYSIKPLSPSLCPILVKENTKMVDGVRSECTVRVYDGSSLVHEETGEILFKDKGLSGIVIFNCCHFINCCNKDKVRLELDLAPRVNSSIKKENYLNYVQPKLAKYLESNSLDIHKVSYSFKGFYDYSTSQVTYGGVELNQIKDNLESKLENGVYFIGEVLDVDAICGGYNMMWCFASACRVSKEI